MRRCDRYQPKEYNPYREFSFENSLRKYEISPQKKVKLRSFVSSGPNIIEPLQDSTYHKDLSNMQCSLVKSKPQKDNRQQKQELEKIDVVEQLMKEVACQGQNEKQKSISFSEEERMSCGFQWMGKNCVEDESIDAASQAVQIGSNEAQASDNNSRDGSINAMQVTQGKFYTPAAQLSQPQRLFEITQLASFKSLPSENEGPSEEALEQKEGRLNINGNISISLRRVNRNRQKGLTQDQMLNQILRKREFLAEEREEIALKLRHYFSSNL